MQLQRRLHSEHRMGGLYKSYVLPAGVVLALGIISPIIRAASAQRGLVPASAQRSLVLTERGRLPGAAFTAVHFHLVVGTVLEGDGSLWVLDHFNKSVRRFDRTGRLLLEFGREGSGPGEFQLPTQLLVTDQRVYVNDSKASRITWFSRTGEYQGDRAYPRRDTVRSAAAFQVFPLRGGQLLVDFVTTLGTTSGSTHYGQSRLVLFDRTGRPTRTVAEYASGHAYGYARSRPTLTTPLDGDFGRGAYTFVAGDSLIVVADAYRGTIQYFEVLSESVRLLRTRDLGWTPHRAAATMEESAVRTIAARRLQVREDDIELKYPPFVGAIRSGVLASTGDLWLHLRENSEAAVKPLGDVFRREYLVVPWNPNVSPYRVTLPENVLLSFVAADHLVGIHLDADRVPTLRVYQIQRDR